MSPATSTPAPAPATSTVTPATLTLAIHVNDQPRTIAAGSTLADLLRDLGLADRKGIAIAINDRVIPRATWPTQTLTTNDRVLVIRATQGG